MTALSDNALAVLRKRYLARDGESVVETPDEMFARVARHIAAVETRWGASAGEVDALAARFASMMAALDFLPNSPTLMNAGRPLGQLAACFVVPVADSTHAIFEAVRWAAEIQKTGGGTGFAFSRLRPAGDRVHSTGGLAAGPVAFMQVFDVATEAIKQGGTRRGANMGILRVDHPDVLDFVGLKLDPSRMRNFNLSLAITDAFMDAVRRGGDYALINPRTGLEVRRLDARTVLDLAANAAWAVGDPGLVFLDRINDTQPTPGRGAIEATNPCVTGETRVWVQDCGMVPIAELVGTRPRIATFADGAVVFREASRVVSSGIRPVARLSTIEGPELRLTLDHRVFTERGDVAAEDLEPGDRIRLLTPRAPDRTERETPDARLGELVGWLTGDGHFTHHGADRDTVVLSFYGRDKRHAGPRLLDTARALVGDDRLALNLIESRDLAYVRSQRLVRALADRQVDGACKRAVPELIWRGGRDMIAGYVRALFSADGSVQGSIGRGASVRLAANELGLLRGVQGLLLGLGIRSVLYRDRRTERLRRMPDANGELREYLCAAQHELAIARGSLRVFSDVVGFLIEEKTERLRAIVDGYTKGPYRDREWVTVSSVTLEGEAEVFDLTEPTTSHFFAEGLLVHNCGEQPLLPFESCTLGSINLARFAERGEVAWDRLRGVIREAVRFLDDVIEANRYPLPEIADATLATRKIGLGVMGFADLLVELGIAYDSAAALELGDRLAQVLEQESRGASEELATTRGPFPAWTGSRWASTGQRPLRNATTTTVAPTGTISILAGCSSGIEPLYALAYQRNVLDGAVLPEVNAAFRRVAVERGFWSASLADAVASHGSARGIDAVPADVQAVFATAHDVSIEGHVRMQAAWQRHMHAAVSKTINLRRDATPADVRAAYELAYELGCKGITVYRDGSRDGQVLTFGEEPSTRAADEGCPECGAALVVHARCRMCRACGWSACS